MNLGTYCVGQFDGWSCFPDTPSNVIAKVLCPPIFEFDTTSKYLHRLNQACHVWSKCHTWDWHGCFVHRIRTQSLWCRRQLVSTPDDEQDMDQLHDLHRCQRLWGNITQINFLTLTAWISCQPLVNSWDDMSI